MTKTVLIFLAFCASVAVLAAFVWTDSSGIKIYSGDDLLGLTCEELSDRHEEVIFAFHDAEISHRRKTGAFHDDLGLPQEDVLPFVVSIRRFLQDNGIEESVLRKASAASISLQRTAYYFEVSATCAANPSSRADDVMRQVAIKLGLIDRPDTP